MLHVGYSLGELSHYLCLLSGYSHQPLEPLPCQEPSHVLLQYSSCSVHLLHVSAQLIEQPVLHEDFSAADLPARLLYGEGGGEDYSSMPGRLV